MAREITPRELLSKLKIYARIHLNEFQDRQWEEWLKQKAKRGEAQMDWGEFCDRWTEIDITEKSRWRRFWFKVDAFIEFLIGPTPLNG